MLAFFPNILSSTKPQMEKGWALFFALTIITIFMNSDILLESDNLPVIHILTSVKAFINIFLFYAVYKTTIYALTDKSKLVSVSLNIYGYIWSIGVVIRSK